MIDIDVSPKIEENKLTGFGVSFSEMQPGRRFVFYAGKDTEGRDAFFDGTFVGEIKTEREAAQEGGRKVCIHLNSGTHHVQVAFDYKLNDRHQRGIDLTSFIHFAPDLILSRDGRRIPVRFPEDFETRDDFFGRPKPSTMERLLKEDWSTISPDRMISTMFKLDPLST